MMLPKVSLTSRQLFWPLFVTHTFTYANNHWASLSLEKSGEYVDMVKAGIIDPLKVIRTALVDAAR